MRIVFPGTPAPHAPGARSAIDVLCPRNAQGSKLGYPKQRPDFGLDSQEAKAGPHSSCIGVRR